MSDYLVKATAAAGKIRMFAAETTGVVEEARNRHLTSPTATAALGRVLTATAMLGAELKNSPDSVTVRLLGDGPLGVIVAVGNAQGEVRGYVANPQADLPLNSKGKLDVGGLVGSKGQLHVTKDLGLKDAYTGSVPLVSGEIGEDFASYYTVSEQTPAAVSLGVLLGRDGLVKAAGGFLIQLLPGAGKELAEELEEKLKFVRPITAILEDGNKLEDIINSILGKWQPQCSEARQLSFKCSCSRPRLERILLSMGKEQLRELYEEGEAELCCQFCGDKYQFSKNELKRLLEEP